MNIEISNGSRNKQVITIPFYEYDENGNVHKLENCDIRNNISRMISHYEKRADEIEKQIENAKNAIESFQKAKEELKNITGGDNELYRKILECAYYI